MVIDCCEMFSFFDIVIHFKSYNDNAPWVTWVWCTRDMRDLVALECVGFPQGSQFVYKRFLVLPSWRIEGTSIFLQPSIKPAELVVVISITIKCQFLLSFCLNFILPTCMLFRQSHAHWVTGAWGEIWNTTFPPFEYTYNR